MQALLDATSSDVVSEMELDCFRDTLLSFLSGKMVFEYEATEAKLDGSGTEITVHNKVTIPPAHRQGWSRVLYANQDVTERRKAETDLNDSARYLSGIMDNINDAIVTIDTNGRVRSFTPSAEKIFGYSSDEVLGRSVNLLMPDDVARSHDKYLKDYARTGHGKIIGIAPREVVGRRRDGSQVWLELGVSEMRLEEQHLFVAVIRDITQRKETEEQMLQASKLAAMGEMAAGISHELKQPLNIISMSAGTVLNVIGKGELTIDYLEKRLRAIEEQSQRSAKIIDNVMRFSRKADYTLERLVLTDTVPRVFDFMGDQLRLAGIKAVMKFPDTCPAIVADPVQIEQVILNLIGNARDAIRAYGENNVNPGGIKQITVSLVHDREGNRVKLAVQDTGGGIPPDVMDNLFDSFFTTKEVGKGTGLGLSVCRSIIENAAGMIEAENANGGARFTVTLPAVNQDIDCAPNDLPAEADL